MPLPAGVLLQTSELGDGQSHLRGELLILSLTATLQGCCDRGSVRSWLRSQDIEPGCLGSSCLCDFGQLINLFEPQFSHL